MVALAILMAAPAAGQTLPPTTLPTTTTTTQPPTTTTTTEPPTTTQPPGTTTTTAAPTTTAPPATTTTRRPRRTTTTRRPAPTTTTTTTTTLPPNEAPTVSATASCQGLVCTFSAEAEDPEGQTVTYLWSFGRTAAETTFIYPEPGAYTETVTATDPLGMAGTASVRVSITSTGATESTSPPQTSTTLAETTTTEAQATPTQSANGGGGPSDGLPTWAFPLIGVGAIAVLVGIIGVGFRLSAGPNQGGPIAVGGIGSRMRAALGDRRRQWADWWIRTKLAISTGRRRLLRPITRQRPGMPLFNRLRIGTRASRSRVAKTRFAVESRRRYWQLSLRNLLRFRRGL